MRKHISEDGQIRDCHAKTPESCTAKGPNGEKTEHFDNVEDARKRSEELLSEQYGKTKVLEKSLNAEKKWEVHDLVDKIVDGKIQKKIEKPKVGSLGTTPDDPNGLKEYDNIIKGLEGLGLTLNDVNKKNNAWGTVIDDLYYFGYQQQSSNASDEEFEFHFETIETYEKIRDENIAAAQIATAYGILSNIKPSQTHIHRYNTIVTNLNKAWEQNSSTLTPENSKKYLKDALFYGKIQKQERELDKAAENRTYNKMKEFGKLDKATQKEKVSDFVKKMGNGDISRGIKELSNKLNASTMNNPAIVTSTPKIRVPLVYGDGTRIRKISEHSDSFRFNYNGADFKATKKGGKWELA